MDNLIKLAKQKKMRLPVVIALVSFMAGCATRHAIYDGISNTILKYCNTFDDAERTMLRTVINEKIYPNKIVIDCSKEAFLVK